MARTNKYENYAEIARKIRAVPKEKPFVCHEWEELLEKMCSSVDTELQDFGHKEQELLNKNSIPRNQK